MGIPKFFRWVSERYPLTSQLITPNSIPTFDNLYLDMNGIIHNCSHPPSSENDPHFRITEEQMVLAIFAYIDHLFTKIKPQKVFFMAIDGVAPRAKMNQQRSRRFRTARDAVEQRREAERKGEKLPEEKAFDSNCITPGTPFMARLSAHLKYYVTKRISEDAEWRNVKVILSGHDVPGEGEHKIQEYIRLSKAQPDYNPNTRHCLYGLDADLIMLGLLSHDPHFCLLREEVTFGRKAKKNTGLANANFYLLHLSLLREYLDLEFSSLSTMPFEYDLERIIDDFILMAIFVGNDFLPHLPDLHINEGALERIWTIYKEILPVAGGYLNEHGTISLPRLQLLLDKLGDFEIEHFEAEFADQNWFKGKQQKEIDAMEKARKRNKLVLTVDQQKLYKQVEKFVVEKEERLALVNSFNARDRRFLQELADELHLRLTWDETDDYGQSLVVFSLDEATDDEQWEDDDESQSAIQRVLTKYTKAKVVPNIEEDFESSYEETLKKKMDEWKQGYYKSKLEFDYTDEPSLRQLIFKYIEGLQWILNYYYKGVSSWGWFYPYHFAPKITDLKRVDEFAFDFDLGKPFTPYQQLMGVLPEESKDHVPPVYRDLMTDPNSPIADFYPRDFELDMNGKKQDWEAVVKIPFIDEARLLKAMAPRDARLTTEERERNKGNVLSTSFEYDATITAQYQSTLPGFFPDIQSAPCRSGPCALPALEGLELVLGLLDGVHLGASALAGFPTLESLPKHGALGYHGINVFQSDSRNPSMVITLIGKHDKPVAAEIAKRMLGQRVYHSWPYLHEGLVVGVSDDAFKYELSTVGSQAKPVGTPLNPFQAIAFKKQADHVEHHQSKRFGVIIGHVDVLLYVRPLKGLKRLETGALVKDYEGPEKEIAQPWQSAVHQVTFEDERYVERDAPPVGTEFPDGERVIFLGKGALYGSAAQVLSTSKDKLNVELVTFANEHLENAEFTRMVLRRPAGTYQPSPIVARHLGISALALSRITSTLLVQLGDGSKTNIGLSLKFESKGQKVLGWSKRNDRGWEYSRLTADALQKYRAAFPEPFRYLDQRGDNVVRSAELCPTAEDPDKVVKDMKKWLKAAGLTDLEPVSLFAEQLEKETIQQIEAFADHCNAQKTPEKLKHTKIMGMPRQAVLKPSHAVYRLQGQHFSLGDRVIMVLDGAAGGVPLGIKGVIVGVGPKDIDVVWDKPFLGGESLQGRCSEYRGSTVPFTSCLNLSRQQYALSMTADTPTPVNRAPFKPQLGPQPAVQMRNFVPATHNPRIVERAKAPPAARHYDQAARGVKLPPAPPAHKYGSENHTDRLAGLLGGAATRWQAQPTVVTPHVAHVPKTHAHPEPTRGRGRGRGGRGGRGRGQ